MDETDYKMDQSPTINQFIKKMNFIMHGPKWLQNRPSRVTKTGISVHFYFVDFSGKIKLTRAKVLRL